MGGKEKQQEAESFQWFNSAQCYKLKADYNEVWWYHLVGKYRHQLSLTTAMDNLKEYIKTSS